MPHILYCTRGSFSKIFLAKISQYTVLCYTQVTETEATPTANQVCPLYIMCLFITIIFLAPTDSYRKSISLYIMHLYCYFSQVNEIVATQVCHNISFMFIIIFLAERNCLHSSMFLYIMHLTICFLAKRRNDKSHNTSMSIHLYIIIYVITIIIQLNDIMQQVCPYVEHKYIINQYTIIFQVNKIASTQVRKQLVPILSCMFIFITLLFRYSQMQLSHKYVPIYLVCLLL